MPAEKTDAIVLRVVPFSETSLVVGLFSREFGKLGALAKGARRPKGPFESALDLLALCRIVFLRKSSDALDLLTEAKLQRRFRVGNGGLGSLYAGYYVAELLNELTDEYDPHPDLFDLADETLEALGAEQPAARKTSVLVVRFELGMLRLLGLLPSLESCAECGAPIEITGRIAFGPMEGGVLCGNCRGGKRQVISVSAGTVRTMTQLAQLADSGRRSWQPVEIDPRSRGELRGVMNHYLVHVLGKRPRMHQYLARLSE